MQSVSIFEVLATSRYPVQHLSSSLNCFTINFIHSRLKNRNKLYTLDRKSFTKLLFMTFLFVLLSFRSLLLYCFYIFFFVWQLFEFEFYLYAFVAAALLWLVRQSKTVV